MKNNKYLFLLDIPLFLVNYIYLILCAKILLPWEFGVLNGFLAVLSVVFVIGVTLQVKAASNSIERLDGRLVLLYSLASLVLCSVICLFLGCNIYEFIALAIIAFLHPFVSVFRGALIAKKRIIKYYKSIYIEMTIKLISIYILFSFAVYTMELILLTLLAGQLVTFFYCIYASDKMTFNTGPMSPRLEREELSLFLNQMAFFIFLNLDIFLLNKYYVESSGFVVLAIRFAQIPLLLSVTFIQFDLDKLRSICSPLLTFKRYFSLMTLLFLATYISMQVIGDLMIPYLFGEEYVESLDYLSHYLIYFYIASFIYVLSLFSSFKNNLSENITFILFSILILFLYSLSGKELIEVLRSEMLFIACYFILLFLFTYFINLKKGVDHGRY